MQRVFLDDLRARFDAQGYVVVENYLDADVVEACREELDAVLRERLGENDDRDARWDELEALGCVAQVNDPARERSTSHEAALDHRKSSSMCVDVVTKTVRRDGAIGSIAMALLGVEDVRFFNDQYIVKPPARNEESLRSSSFQWHYDSQWCDAETTSMYTAYLSCWVPLDDVSEENGTLRILPYPEASSAAATHREKALAYPSRQTLPSPLLDGGCDGAGRLITVSAGSVVFFSDVVLHCSGPNIGDSIRRVWMPQFSAGPILRRDGRPVSLTAKLV